MPLTVQTIAGYGIPGRLRRAGCVRRRRSGGELVVLALTNIKTGAVYTDTGACTKQ